MKPLPSPAEPVASAWDRTRAATERGAFDPTTEPTIAGYFTRVAGVVGPWRCTNVAQTFIAAPTEGSVAARIDAALSSVQLAATTATVVLMAAPDGTLRLEVRAYAPGTP